MECVACKKRKHKLIIEVSPCLSGACKRASVRAGTLARAAALGAALYNK